MTGAACPACGVAVVPGYVRCPKCHRPLPRGRSSASPIGGTSIESRSGASPMIAVALAVVIAGGIIAYFALRKGKSPGSTASPTATAPTGAETTTETPTAPPPAAVAAGQPAAARGPSADVVASDLERSLKHARLWSTVTVIGDHVDVRSGSCGDAALKSALDGAIASFKAAGLTKLRCLEQSGSVVFDRDF